MHFKNSQGKEDKTEKQKVTDLPKLGEIDVSEAEGPCKVGEMGEREDEGKLLSPKGKILKGEESSAEEKHRCDK